MLFSWLKRYADKIGLGFLAILFTAYPWENFAGGFVDRAVYKNYFLYEVSVLDYKKFTTFFDYVTNEYLWHFVIKNLIAYIEIEWVFLAISLFAAVVFFNFIVTQHGFIALAFLINPLIVDLFFSQLRLALAFAILLFAYQLTNRYILAFCAVVAAFIHTAVLLFVLIFFIARLVSRFNFIILISSSSESDASKYFKYAILFSAGLLISLLLGPLREPLLSIVGDRRATYSPDMTSTLAYTSLWLLLLPVFLLQTEKWFKSEINCFATIITTLVVFCYFFSTYGTRFLAAGLPMIICAIMDMDEPWKAISLIAITGYMILQWIYWFRIWMV